MKRSVSGFFWCYRAIRLGLIDPVSYALLGYRPTCRYSISCSHYAERVLQEHATIPAIHLIMRRVLSCHGWRT